MRRVANQRGNVETRNSPLASQPLVWPAVVTVSKRCRVANSGRRCRQLLECNKSLIELASRLSFETRPEEVVEARLSSGPSNRERPRTRVSLRKTSSKRFPERRRENRTRGPVCGPSNEVATMSEQSNQFNMDGPCRLAIDPPGTRSRSMTIAWGCLNQQSDFIAAFLAVDANDDDDDDATRGDVTLVVCYYGRSRCSWRSH